MMAEFARSTAFGTVVRYATHFSLFGAFWLAWFLATISQFAINDGNYYEAVNAFQNIFGGWHKWKRALLVPRVRRHRRARGLARQLRDHERVLQGRSVPGGHRTDRRR